MGSGPKFMDKVRIESGGPISIIDQTGEIRL